MTHLTDDELVLHYYREADAGAHLAACVECTARYRELTLLMDAVEAAPLPERDAAFGARIWQRVQPRLDVRRSWRPSWQWAAAAAAVVLLAAGFEAGRLWTPAPAPRPAASAVTQATTTIPGNERRRVLLMSVADYLDRSDRVLTEVMHAPGGDLSAEQQWAGDLVATSRLYRQAALDANEPSVASVLDELERTLLDIVHHPSNASAGDLEQLRRRIDSASLLFKVRVMRADLRVSSSSIG